MLGSYATSMVVLFGADRKERDMGEHTHLRDEPEDPSLWRVEAVSNGRERWATNAMRYDTEDEALSAGASLFMRWLGCYDYRVVPNGTPDREQYVEGSGRGR